MFFRLKKSGERGYMQIVENKRDGAAVRQKVIANLGRADELAASGALASLIASGAKLTDQVLLINALDEDAEGALSVAAKRIGGPMLFGRIWERLGVADVLADLLKARAFEFPVERAVFVASPASAIRLGIGSRLFVVDGGLRHPRRRGARSASLLPRHGLARRGDGGEAGKGARAALRQGPDRGEAVRPPPRSLHRPDLSAVFMDTTSLSFYGEGGETLGEHGYSKDYRPDFKQMILGLVVDGDGRPICTEMWPGNTADVTSLLPVVDRLRRALFHRPGLRRRRPRHDLGRNHRRARGAQARIYPWRARALRRGRAQDRARERRPVRALSSSSARRERPNSSSSRSRSKAPATSSAATRRRPRTTARTAKRSSPRSTPN